MIEERVDLKIESANPLHLAGIGPYEITIRDLSGKVFKLSAILNETESRSDRQSPITRIRYSLTAYRNVE
jgi:hypothetical protein